MFGGIVGVVVPVAKPKVRGRQYSEPQKHRAESTFSSWICGVGTLGTRGRTRKLSRFNRYPPLKNPGLREERVIAVCFEQKPYETGARFNC